MYYLYWVCAYWLGRIGYHDPNLILSNGGWQVILWSFWHGFIQKEGRLFFVIAFGLSMVVFGIGGLVYLIKQAKIILKEERLKHDDAKFRIT